MQTCLFICGSAWKSKHNPFFKFTWNLPLLEVSTTHKICLFGSFCNSIHFETHEICHLRSFCNSFHFATFCHIFQRYCNFCSNIFNFCKVIATFLIFATFLHCNFWQNALSLPILFIAIIMQSFTMQFITWFWFERYRVTEFYLIKVLLLKVLIKGPHNYWVTSALVIANKMVK